MVAKGRIVWVSGPAVKADGMYFIKATLEEREREDFVRLKKVKVVLDKKKIEQESALKR